MPLQLSYPGVYIEELPSGVQTVTGVPTSITAFVGRAALGPVNDPQVINSFSDYQRTFGGLWLSSSMSYAVKDFYLNGGSQAVIVRLANGGSAATITLPEQQVSPPLASPPAGTPVNLVLQAASIGTWGAGLSAIVDFKTQDPTNTLLFNLTLILTSLDGTQILATEKYLNLSVDPGAVNYVVTVLEQDSSLVIVQEDSSGNPQVPAVRPDITASVGSPPNNGRVWAVGGNDGNALTANDFTDTTVPKTGLYALENTDIFNLLCIPPYDDDNPTVDPTVVAAAGAYCEQRRAFYIVDAPDGWNTIAKAVNGAEDFATNVGTRSSNAGIFFPRLLEADPLRNNQVHEFASCGAVAGIFSRTDAQRGVWKAPAGQDGNFVGISGFTVPMTDAENGELNPLGVNCLRSFPVVGPVVWGSRTMTGADQLASQWKYVPVRRLALYLEESLYRSSKWIVFEPNDEPLWAQIRLDFGAFMQSLFLQGAFQGSSPRDAYFVKCDSETTTQNDIDQGIVNIIVGFAPLKPAEFVVIQLQQLAGQVNV
jgi:phage tail sheath protein FI